MSADMVRRARAAEDPSEIERLTKEIRKLASSPPTPTARETPGKEAEELRAGLERLTKRAASSSSWTDEDWHESIAKLLDRTDARDSLEHLAARDARETELAVALREACDGWEYEPADATAIARLRKVAEG